MKAAGLDAAGMQSISTDSLRKIITYHILPGSIDNMALDNLPVSRFLQTLRLDTIQVPFQGSSVRESYMNVQKGDKLYLNGYAFNNQAPLAASNGYVYPIGLFLHNDFIDESRTLWDIVQSEPDLSMFRDAIQLLDSIKESESYLEQEVFWFILSPPSDIPLMSNRKWDPIRNRFNIQGMPLILAPVNQAFYDAGFHSIDDLRTFRLPLSIWRESLCKPGLERTGTEVQILFPGYPAGHERNGARWHDGWHSSLPQPHHLCRPGEWSPQQRQFQQTGKVRCQRVWGVYRLALQPVSSPKLTG